MQNSAFLGQLVKLKLWHQRLGHLTHEILSVMLKQSNISLEIDSYHSLCTHYVKGKMSMITFPTRSDKCSLPFQKVHSNIWGSSPVKSIEGHIY